MHWEYLRVPLWPRACETGLMWENADIDNTNNNK